jgi:hypothetical protein
VKRRPISTTDFNDLDALAREALNARTRNAQGCKRIEALKQASQLRMAADREQLKRTPLGRPPKDE